MALPNHPDVCYEFVRTLLDSGYRWVLVQEHTVERVEDGGPVADPHLPHRLIARNSLGQKLQQCGRGDQAGCAKAGAVGKGCVLHPQRKSEGLSAVAVNLGNSVEHLRRNPSFSSAAEGAEDVCRFTYAPADCGELAALRSDYALEAVADEGTSLARAMKLMDWVHRQLPHTGTPVAPKIRSARHILHLVRGQSGALNCRMHAIVLTEVLLSLGLRARSLVCMPMEFDGDCHVITIVYAPELARWICLDAFFNTWFRQASGQPMGIQEIRDAYRAGTPPQFEPIRIPVTAPIVFAGEPCASYGEFYRAKNCFRFCSSLDTAPGCDSSPDRRFVFLDPLGFAVADTCPYDTHLPPHARLYTHSADCFFKAPHGTPGRR